MRAALVCIVLAVQTGAQAARQFVAVGDPSGLCELSHSSSDAGINICVSLSENPSRWNVVQAQACDAYQMLPVLPMEVRRGERRLLSVAAVRDEATQSALADQSQLLGSSMHTYISGRSHSVHWTAFIAVAVIGHEGYHVCVSSGPISTRRATLCRFVRQQARIYFRHRVKSTVRRTCMSLCIQHSSNNAAGGSHCSASEITLMVNTEALVNHPIMFEHLWLQLDHNARPAVFADYRTLVSRYLLMPWKRWCLAHTRRFEYCMWCCCGPSSCVPPTMAGLRVIFHASATERALPSRHASLMHIAVLVRCPLFCHTV